MEKIKNIVIVVLVILLCFFCYKASNPSSTKLKDQKIVGNDALEVLDDVYFQEYADFYYQIIKVKNISSKTFKNPCNRIKS